MDLAKSTCSAPGHRAQHGFVLFFFCGCHWGKMNKSVSSGCGRRQAPETAMLSMAWIKGTGQGRTGSLSADSNRGKR